MAAKGTIAKENLFKKLREVFPNAFFDDKVLRVPMDDGGTLVEIKVALTCAKDILGGDTVSEGEPERPTAAPVEDMPNANEIQSLKNLFNNWGL